MPSTKLGQYITTTLIADRLIEQRYHPLAIPSPALFLEARKARERITRKAGPSAVLIVLPLEMPVDPPSTNVDFFRQESQMRSILALAVVAESAVVNAATKFYFRYHAQSFEAKVFTEEAEARAWLQEQLKMDARA
ncbi:MAG: STAS/SEC14 domain-containing protein [Flavobacteriales bacterium]|nr:STAS/SEC14 domain-containing protein [Flavobacteriales bacterium]